MKANTSKVSADNHAAAKPFFNKGGDRSFFSKEAAAESSFFTASNIQASMTVGQPDDPFEQEAEKVSRQVVEGFDQANSIQRKFFNVGLQPFTIQPFTIGSRISKKIQKAISRRPLFIQAKCAHCDEEDKMQQKSGSIQFAGDGARVSPQIESQIQSMRGGGQGMDSDTRTAMESSFGADFSGVKVHTNSQAVQMSQQLNAHAFTVGNDIFFNEGRYQPKTKQGAGLLAHELTHTVQQGASVQNKRINTSSLFSSLSAHSAAHLSAINGGNVPALSKKEMAQLEQLPEEEMKKMQQLQMLQMKGVDKVQKKDGALSLRRCPTTGPARRAVLKSGPTYTPNGTITPTVSGGLKRAHFTMAAEFENDPSKGIYAACGEVRQYMKWSVGEAPPSHAGWTPASSFSADTWYEDRNDSGQPFGHRVDSQSTCGFPDDKYLDSTNKLDCANGIKYVGDDPPAGVSTRTGFWYFKLEAIDVCNGNKVLGTDYVTIDF